MTAPAPVVPMVFDTTPVTITYEDAADPLKYRAARAIAHARGVPLDILPRVAAPTWKPEPGAVVIPKDADHATYKAMRADAIARGVPYVVHP